MDCQACGACCVEAGDIPVERGEWMPPRLLLCGQTPKGYGPLILSDGRAFMARHIGGRCKALEGEIGADCRCGIYERRPAVCRAFAPGSEGCLAARETMVRKLGRMEMRPRGYGPNWQETVA